jgi:hypothetical protein
MRGNDEHDPLDSWLGQQVRPMPPPPGTFELITRRARRRKIRKLAISVGSAAAVAAAAVIIAVPGGLLLHLSPSSTATGVAAGRQTQPVASSGTQQVTGHGTHTPSASAKPTHSTTPSPATSDFTAPLGPVPANFMPSSVTFVSTSDAWVIGQAGAPGHCADANPDFCTSVVHTDDAGKTWYGGPAPRTSQPDGPVGVSGIRFLDGVNGWAFGPELWVTHNAGNSWSQVPTDGSLVTDLETANGRAYALWAMCGNDVADFAGDCTSYTLMTTTAGSDNWAPVGGATSGLTNGGADTSAVLALTGSVGYLVAPDGTLYSGPIGGTWQKAGTVPCQPGQGDPHGLPDDITLALQDSTQLAVACTGPSFPGATVFTSDDGGANWSEQAAAAWSGLTRPGSGEILSLASAPNGTLVLATGEGLDVLPAGASHWQLSRGPSAMSEGFTYVGMTTDEQGVAVSVDSGLHEIWMTFDGGVIWEPRIAITPGN